jgi:hypothetical protein
MLQKTRLVAFATVALTALSATPGLASAQSDAVGGNAPVPGAYTLDGAPSSASGVAGAAVCAAILDASGTENCFSSMKSENQATLSALQAGKVPAGWAALPPAADVARAVSALRIASTGDASLTPPAAASIARRHGPRAHKADGAQCSGQATIVYENNSFGGAAGSTGYTGTGAYAAYSATYNNIASSFWATAGYTSRWHDYSNGTGAYYGNGYSCRYVENLGNANMDDGGTANDRFSSVGTW